MNIYDTIFDETCHSTVFDLSDKNDHALMLMVENRLFPNYKMPLHTHRQFEISCLTEGHARYEIGNRGFDVAAGDIVLISNRDAHRIVLTNRDPVVNLVLHLEPEMLLNSMGDDVDYRLHNIFLAHEDDAGCLLSREHPSTRTVNELIRRVSREFREQRPHYDLQIRILVPLILAEILRGYECFEGVADNPGLSRKDLYRTKDVMKYIDLNLSKQLTLQELAGISHISAPYFSSMFKRYVGINLFEYIARKRVEQAILLMKTDSEKTLTEIASLCGFNSSTSFNKTFRRITGCPPSHFRKHPNANLG